MLEHQKKVLQNVSYNPDLFYKELVKSINWLPSHEVFKLYSWVKLKFGATHYHVIKKAFALVAA